MPTGMSAWQTESLRYGLVKQVFAPLGVAFAEHSHQMAAGVEAERTGLTGELHACLLRRSAALAVIARMAAGDEVFPRGLTGAGSRDHVVECEFGRGKGAVAILASVAVAHEDVLAREGASLVRDTAIFEQANDGREPQGGTGGVDGEAGFLFGRRHALQNEHKGAPRSTDIDRLIAGVEDQHRFL